MKNYLSKWSLGIVLGCGLLFASTLGASAQDKNANLKTTVKISIEKDGKFELIEQSYVGEMPQEVKDRLAQAGVDLFENNIGSGSDIQLEKEKADGSKVRVVIRKKDDQGNVMVFNHNGGDSIRKNVEVKIIKKKDENGNTVIIQEKDGVKEITTDSKGKNVEVVVVQGNQKNAADAPKQVRVEKNVEVRITKDGQSEQNIVIVIKEVKLQDISEKEMPKNLQLARTESFSEQEMKNLNVYPNPNTGSFKLQFELEKKGDTDIRIYDLNGSEIYGEKLANFQGAYQKEITLPENAQGSYLLKIEQGGKVLTKKMIVK
jgi:Secretion system C-terminal sorting domain